MDNMKKLTLLLSLLLVLITGNHVNATPADTLTRYYINGLQVENFDGSQLIGKTIVTYRMEYITLPGQTPVRVHVIFTEEPSQVQPSIRIRPVEGAQQADPAYVIDGKQISKKEFENLDPANIKSMTVIKGGSQEDVKQYEGWENGVILVETKEGARKK